MVHTEDCSHVLIGDTLMVWIQTCYVFFESYNILLLKAFNKYQKVWVSFLAS